MFLCIIKFISLKNLCKKTRPWTLCKALIRLEQSPINELNLHVISISPVCWLLGATSCKRKAHHFSLDFLETDPTVIDDSCRDDLPRTY